MTIWRVLATWLLLAFLMTLNGILREAVIEPALGPTKSDIISAALGLAIILGVTAAAFRPLRSASTARLVVISLLLVGLTVAFELVIGHWVDGKSWSELAANYAIWDGRLWPILLLAVALSPFLWGRWTRPDPLDG